MSIEGIKTWAQENPVKATAAAVGTAAAAGSLIYAAVKGKPSNPDTFMGKTLGRVGNGYKDLGSKIAGGAKKVWGAITGIFKGKEKNAAKAAQAAGETASGAAAKVEDATKKAADAAASAGA